MALPRRQLNAFYFLICIICSATITYSGRIHNKLTGGHIIHPGGSVIGYKWSCIGLHRNGIRTGFGTQGHTWDSTPNIGAVGESGGFIR